MTDSITDNAARHRFELSKEGHTVYADYRRSPGVLEILYVESPPSLRGTGAAGILMQGILEQARKDGVKVRPICSYAAAWIKRSKDFADMLAN